MSFHRREARRFKAVFIIAHIFSGVFIFAIRMTIGQPQDLKNLHLLENRQLKQGIVVGKLTGHDDYRNLHIQLQNTSYRITKQGNSLPFKVVIFSPQWLEIKFTNEYRENPSDPQSIAYRFFQNERSLMTSLILEQVDYAVLRRQVQAREINRANPNIVIIPLRTPANDVQMVVYNLRNSVLKYVAVRKAISYAINKRLMVRDLLGNGGEVARGSPFEPDQPFYPKGIDDYKYEPKKALELLSQAGWRDLDGDGVLEKDGLNLRIHLAFEMGIQLEEKVARRIKLDLFEIGIEIIPVSYSKIELKNKLHRGEFEAVLLEHQFTASIDSLYGFFADKKNGFVQFSNRNFEYIFQQFRRLSQPEKARTFARRMQAILNRYSVASFLFYRWYDYHLFNIKKIGNFYDEQKAQIKPFNEWTLRQQFKK